MAFDDKQPGTPVKLSKILKSEESFEIKPIDSTYIVVKDIIFEGACQIQLTKKDGPTVTLETPIQQGAYMEQGTILTKEFYLIIKCIETDINKDYIFEVTGIIIA